MLAAVLIIAVLLGPTAAVAVPAKGDYLRLGAASGSEALPDLPGQAQNGDWQLGIAESGASLAYADASESWQARVDGGFGLPSSILLSHALRLSDRLTAGTRLSHGGGRAEALFNSVYAYKKNTRFRFSAAQSRTSTGTPSERQSYLIGAKKYWTGRIWSDAGIRIYLIDARNTAVSTAPEFDAESGGQAMEALDDEARYGRMHGMTLDLGFRPLPGGRLDLRHEFNTTTQRYASLADQSRRYSLSSIVYSHEFRNCTNIRAGYTGGTSTTRLELRIGHGNWNIQAWQNFAQGGKPAFLFAYAAELGRTGTARVSCARAQAQQGFEPMIDAAAGRPEQFLYEPL